MLFLAWQHRGMGIEFFADRTEAGRLLGERLLELSPAEGWADTMVLGLARGGVVVAAAVAKVLGVPFDVVVTRKVGAPGNPEFGLGAVAPGVTRLGPHAAAFSDARYLNAEVAAQMKQVEERTRLYRGDSPEPDLSGRTAVVVDDGIATGGTALAALEYARSRGAARVILAVPVGPPGVAERIGEAADEVVVLAEPFGFSAVGQFYGDFSQVEDDGVIETLERREADQGEGSAQK